MFDSVLLASFVAILLSPNFARRRASNLCVLHNTIYTKSHSAVARTLIGGGGGVYIHIFRFCLTSFF